MTQSPLCSVALKHEGISPRLDFLTAQNNGVSGDFRLKDIVNLDVFYFSTVVNPVRRNEAYGVYLTLAKMDVEAGKRLQSVDLDHAYYDVNVSGDGSEIYIGCTMGDIAVYSSETLEKLGSIALPGAADMALSNLRVVDR